MTGPLRNFEASRFDALAFKEDSSRDPGAHGSPAFGPVDNATNLTRGLIGRFTD